MKPRYQLRHHRVLPLFLTLATSAQCCFAAPAQTTTKTATTTTPAARSAVSKPQAATASGRAPSGRDPSGSAPALPARVLTEDQRILHALNRLAFGARPGDVEHVRRIGLQRWIAQQIQPVGIDDAAVEQKLSRLRTLQYSSQQLGLAYAADTLFRRQMAVERRERQLQRGAMNDAAAPLAAPMQEAMPLSGAAPLPGKRDTTPPGMLPQGMLPQGMTPQQQRVMEEARREGMSQGIAAQVVGELVTAKLVRAVESKRQLHEVMVDFWSNHFNLDVKKGPVRTYKVADEREVIRPHIWGKFRDLLGASAKSPAMLFYLDNVRSTRPMETRPLVSGGARRALRARQNQSALSQSALSQNAMPQNAATGDAMMPAMLEAEADIAPAMRGGINENYARELMELHTMGVAGGYTQKDVQEVARCFTGWSISRQTGEFQFRRFAHDNGEKVVLGQRIAPGGFMQDGERVLDILATHSSTARFLATKVSTRLVSDQPPAALVERAAQAFLKSDGDLRVLVETVVQSPEFWSADSYRAKIKSPFEYAVSAVRALGGTVLVPDATRPAGRSTLIAVGTTSINPNAGAQRNARAARSLAHEIAAMGQPLYSFQAPTGYPEKSQSWVSAGALVSRLNFALSLTSGRVYNARLTPQTLVAGLSGDDRQATLDRLLGQLVGSDVSTATRQTLQKAVAPNAPIDVARWSALILGSPEFQRR